VKFNAERIEEGKPLVKASKVNDFEDGRLVLMFSMGYPNHIGVAVNGYGVLHMDRKMGSVLVRRKNLRYKVEGIYSVG